jgi:CheY-like chemotaxis protein
MPIKSLLILDDDQEMLDLVENLVKPILNTNSITTRFPTRAIQLAEQLYFDFVLLDVTISYNGSQFGGLDVYKILRQRYGDASIIAYSQYINDELLQRYGLPFNFSEKDTNMVLWVKRLTEEMLKLRNQQTCFVAMPFGSKYRELYRAIRLSVEGSGYRCIRIDERAFTQSIVTKIFTEIKKAKLIIFVATDKNPNVYFEAGYAVALGKEVITVTDKFENLPFDIRDRNAVSYVDDPKTLQSVLIERLSSLTDLEQM